MKTKKIQRRQDKDASINQITIPAKTHRSLEVVMPEIIWTTATTACGTVGTRGILFPSIPFWTVLTSQRQRCCCPDSGKIGPAACCFCVARKRRLRCVIDFLWLCTSLTLPMPWQVLDFDLGPAQVTVIGPVIRPMNYRLSVYSRYYSVYLWSDVEGEKRLVNKQILAASAYMAYMGLYFPLFSSCHPLPLECDPKIFSGIRHDPLHSATTHRFTPQRNSDTRKMRQ